MQYGTESITCYSSLDAELDRRVPPHAREAERSLLAAILVDGNRLAEIRDIVKSGDFHEHRNGVTFEHMPQLFDVTGKIDTPLLVDSLRAMNQLEDIGGMPYLAELATAESVLENATSYARSIREHADRRRAIAAANDLRLDLSKGGDITALMQQFSESTRSVGSSSGGVVTIAELIEEVRGQEAVEFYPVGLPIQIGRGEISVFGAPPGMGKTALVMQLAVDALRCDPNLSVLIANAEMQSRDLLCRQIARLSGIPLSVIRDGHISAASEAAVDTAYATLNELNERLLFWSGPADLDAIGGVLRSKRPDWVIIDYIQKFGSGDGLTGVEKIDRSMAILRQWTKDFNISVTAISSLNRSSGKDEQTGMGAFRGSAELEYNADAGFMLESANKNDDEQAVPRLLTLRCVKARHAKKNDIDLSFYGNVQRFVQADIEFDEPASDADN